MYDIANIYTDVLNDVNEDNVFISVHHVHLVTLEKKSGE